MPTGDLIVREHNSPASLLVSGSSATSAYDTQVKKVGTAITAGGGLNIINEAGRYLISYSEHWGRDDLSSRLNFSSWIRVNSVDTPYHGFSSGYARGQRGSVSAVSSGSAILDLDDGDIVGIRSFRSDTSGLSHTVHTQVPGRSLTILKLDDTLSYGSFSGPSTASSTTDNATVTLPMSGDNETRGAAFRRNGDVVTVTTDNPVLFAYSARSTDHSETKSRSDYQSVLYAYTGGEIVPISYDSTYVRGAQGTNQGGMSTAGILAPQSGATNVHNVSLRVISRETGGDQFAGRLQLFELPVTAKVFLAEINPTVATNMNTDGVRFPWEDPPVISTGDDFTFPSGSQGSGGVTLGIGGDYLAFATVAKTVGGSFDGSRAVPGIRFAAPGDSADSTIGGDYFRGAGTANFPAMSVSGVLTDLRMASNVGAQTSSLNPGNTTVIPTGAGGFALVQVVSLIPQAGRTVAGAARAGVLAAGTVMSAPRHMAEATARAGAIVAGNVVLARRHLAEATATVGAIITGRVVAARRARATVAGVSFVSASALAAKQKMMRIAAAGVAFVAVRTVGARQVVGRARAGISRAVGGLSTVDTDVSTVRAMSGTAAGVVSGTDVVATSRAGRVRSVAASVVTAGSTTRRRMIARMVAVVSVLADADTRRLVRFHAHGASMATARFLAVARRKVESASAGVVVSSQVQSVASRTVRAVEAAGVASGLIVAEASRLIQVRAGVALVSAVGSARRTVSVVRDVVAKVRSRYNRLKVR